MTREDVIKLLAFIEAANPSQKIGDLTPAAWHEIIPGDFAPEECAAAAVSIIRRGRNYVDLGDLIAEVRRARRPAGDAAHLRALLDPAEYRAGIEAADERTETALARIEARLGRRARLRAIPPPDYDDGEDSA